MDDFLLDYGYAEYLDKIDELAKFRNEFVITDPSLIYMDGNSLGRLPKRSFTELNNLISYQWGDQLIRSWNQNWINLPISIGEIIAHLIGAKPEQTIVSDSTSVNLFKLVCAVLEIQNNRKKIISDMMNFPSDLYILQGCIKLFNNKHELILLPSEDEISMNTAVLLDAIDHDTALVTLSHITFKSGYLYDIASITQKAHQVGALVIWDLSHSAGVVKISLDEWDVDFATGCTYKYLNGGPGAPAYIYIRKDIQNSLSSPIWGWFGAQSPFKFDLEFKPQEGIRQMMCGTPPIISLQAIQAGAEIILEADIANIRKKSVLMSEYMISLFDSYLSPLGYSLGSPRCSDRRGSHISIRHPFAYQINQCLIAEKNVIPDFREPDNIRFGLAPLYNSFTDIWHVVNHMKTIVEEQRYKKYAHFRNNVT